MGRAFCSTKTHGSTIAFHFATGSSENSAYLPRKFTLLGILRSFKSGRFLGLGFFFFSLEGKLCISATVREKLTFHRRGVYNHPVGLIYAESSLPPFIKGLMKLSEKMRKTSIRTQSRRAELFLRCQGKKVTSASRGQELSLGTSG